MFFVPTGIWQKAPGITVGLYIWKGIIPALIGNIIGGGLFVGIFYWYLHLSNEEAVAIDGVLYEPLATEGQKSNMFTKSHFGTKSSKDASEDEEKGMSAAHTQTN